MDLCVLEKVNFADFLRLPYYYVTEYLRFKLNNQFNIKNNNSLFKIYN
jgi:hypothetical protein